ncbi:1-deoxy-D-xylulose 5-phosphate synthase [Thermogutta terrifontis]|uniref:1-deoxy-D-xylulose-5-phosphate synthase n=1 Tax=Thermogutta terrifontis TaxID=1331910 RepID=A0A286RF47_9BACT|nr:1-deoxy-D-xylulose-5-phosphate synthase [Thermogutta terrifontis]ASV74583.1 1-deoxy-D-xylulose 5-phosphate synthase [Thermogutta terrifontis]
MVKILNRIKSPQDLQSLSLEELQELAGEIRETMCQLLGTRSAHFASNLGVVELTLALHTVFDFSRDRLIWDTGHQVYPHKMITGRFDRFHTIRTKGGLMGYPNPAESPYDLFMTGHAGCSISTAVGLKCGDDLVRPEEHRHVVAVIGDGAFPSGIVSEAMNHAGWLKKPLIVVLNDNRMSICQRVGGIAEYLDRLRMAPLYSGIKNEVYNLLSKVPLVGTSMERLLDQLRDAIKAGMLGGMLFEELGFRYIGPVDGHNIAQLQKYLRMVKQFPGPVLLHVLTEKGRGFPPAERDPRTFHAPAPFHRINGTEVAFKSNGSSVTFTEVARNAILEQMRKNKRVVVITAAMCQGNMLEPVRDEFPDRYFDVGICESHAVGFAAGLAKAGVRPIVDIYSTFLQRAYDQLFQEVSLQNLPVVFMMDRAGVVGADGPTHHGVFDFAYFRPFPNVTVMAPGDAADLPAMLEFALSHDGPVAIRYPKAKAEKVPRTFAPVTLGKAERIRDGADGTIICCGALLPACVAAAEQLAQEGLNFGVINARFVKPLDTETILSAIEESPVVITVEEGVLQGGFGSAVLEAANDAGLNTSHIKRLGIPDRFVEHAERGEQLADLGLDVEGIAQACRQAAERRCHRRAFS